jgi:hypothetical protein
LVLVDSSELGYEDSVELIYEKLVLVDTPRPGICFYCLWVVNYSMLEGWMSSHLMIAI